MTKLHGGAIVDIGNVVIAYRLSDLTSENYDTYDFDSIPEEPGAFQALELMNIFFDGNVTIAWKATDDAVGKNMRWLRLKKFNERTGIPQTRIERIGLDRKGKTDFIGQSSETHEGTTVVIDDRLEVLCHFVGKVPHLFLFRPQLKEVHRYASTGALAHVKVVWSWDHIIKELKL